MSWQGDYNERVLVPVGGDACSKDALRWAVANKIARPDDLLVLLHIVTKAPGPDGYDVGQSELSKTSFVQHVRTAIMPMLSQLKASVDPKVRLELKVGRNDSRDVGIMEEAIKLQATCLVLATKARGLFSMRSKLSGSTSAFCLKHRPPTLSVVVVSKDKVLLSKHGEATPPERSPSLSLTGSPLPGSPAPNIPSASSSPGSSSRRNSESRFDPAQGERGNKSLSEPLSVPLPESDLPGDCSTAVAASLSAAGGERAVEIGQDLTHGERSGERGGGKGEERGFERDLQQVREQQQQRMLLHQQQQQQAAVRLAALMEGVSVRGGGGGGAGGGEQEGGSRRGGAGEGVSGARVGGYGGWSDANDAASAAHAVARSQQRTGVSNESMAAAHGSVAGVGFPHVPAYLPLNATKDESGAQSAREPNLLSSTASSSSFSVTSSSGSTFTMGNGSSASSRNGTGSEATGSPISNGSSGISSSAAGAKPKEAAAVVAAAAVAAAAAAAVAEAKGEGGMGGKGEGAPEAASGMCCRLYAYEDIQRATDDFSPQLLLGEGGCGTVYSGILGGSKVAVKVIKTADADRAAKEFQREVELLSQIQHPHIVSLLGCCPARHCIVYEFMACGTLEERLLCANNSPPLPWFARLRIAAEIASGLLALHSQPIPIIHLDLKPANVLLDERLVAKLGDVGVARLMPGGGGSGPGCNVTHAHTSMPIGTVAYVDPEYQRTGDFSPKSDVYALGIILFDLLTGRQPSRYERIEDAVDEESEEALGKLLDWKAGKWPVGLAMEVARIAVRCSEMKRKKRPDLGEVVMPVLVRAQKEAVMEMERMMAGL
ncbi:hypothetical protein CLOP_g1700 [Closterium sp. NIES-67]|nr:hypothetical protein CLOP_g1700 [Closterium sp. NIES-67]